MNEVTFVLAILLDKEIITKEEAKRYHNSLKNGTLSPNLTDMIEKIKKAETPPEGMNSIDAKDFFSSK